MISKEKKFIPFYFERFLKSSALKFWSGLFLIHFVLRISGLYTVFLDVDESQFAGFAHTLIEGGLPYAHSLDTKPLGIYLFYYFIFQLFGKYNMYAIHLVTTLWLFLTSYYLFLCFKIFNKNQAGRLASLFFVIFSTTYIPK